MTRARRFVLMNASRAINVKSKGYVTVHL